MLKDKGTKSFFINIILNTIGFALVTGTVQLLLYPFLGRIMSPSEYGLAITLIGFTNLFTAVFGNSLRNCRLKEQKTYTDKKIQNDFGTFFLIGLICNIIFIFIISLVYNPQITMQTLSLVVLMSALAYTRVYYSVEYLLKLNYVHLVIMSLFTGLGYVVGVFIASKTDIWPLSFIIGELFGCIYLFFTTDLFKDIEKPSQLFKSTGLIYLSLIVVYILRNIPIYADRIFIYPLLGAESVSTYYVAVFFGRVIGALATPIAGVVFSYYAQETSMRVQTFWRNNIFILTSAVIFFVISLFAAEPITAFFYPTIIGTAKPYLLIANSAIIIFFAANIINIALLRFCSMRIQLAIQLTSAFLYIALSILFTKWLGLIGFCYAMLLTNLISLGFILSFGTHILKQNSVSAFK